MQRRMRSDGRLAAAARPRTHIDKPGAREPKRERRQQERKPSRAALAPHPTHSNPATVAANAHRTPARSNARKWSEAEQGSEGRLGKTVEAADEVLMLAQRARGIESARAA